MADPHPSLLLEQTLWDLFWIPPDITVVDRPELLAMQCPRPVPYLNMVLRTRAPAHQLPALVAEVGQLHRHCTSRWVVTDTTDTAPLTAALAAGGYEAAERHDVRAVHVDAVASRTTGNWLVRDVDSMARLREEYDVIGQAFGMGVSFTDESLAKDLELCTEPAARVHRFLAYDATDRPVATGALTVYPSLGFGLLWGGGTIPDARGRGAYAAIMAARVARARVLGVSCIGLYARVDTSSPIVARLGFARWGEMTWWKRLPPADQASSHP